MSACLWQKEKEVTMHAAERSMLHLLLAWGSSEGAVMSQQVQLRDVDACTAAQKSNGGWCPCPQLARRRAMYMTRAYPWHQSIAEHCRVEHNTRACNILPRRALTPPASRTSEGARPPCKPLLRRCRAAPAGRCTLSQPPQLPRAWPHLHHQGLCWVEDLKTLCLPAAALQGQGPPG